MIYRKHSSLESLDKMVEAETTPVAAAPVEVQVVVATSASAISHSNVLETKDTPREEDYATEKTTPSDKREEEDEDEDDEWEETDAIGIDSSLRIPLDHVNLKKKIGHGAFGKV